MQYVLAHHSKYLVTSEVWHPHLIGDSRVSLLYESTCPLVMQEGGYSIGIYRVAPQ
jgi:hypothetical protein